MTPLVLLAGFLGAGKTSFLRRLLPELAARGIRPRVILNDYENAQVDAASLSTLRATLVPISGSCLCCDTQEHLLAALAEMPPGAADVVLVECSGTTDTGTLIELLTESPGLDKLSLPLQITVIDGQRFGTRGWQDTIEAEQIATATHLAVSRADLVSPTRLAEVASAAGGIQPHAVSTSPEAFADGLVVLMAQLVGTAGRSATGNRDSRPAHTPAKHPFASLQVPLPFPVDEAAFQRFLDDLPPEILRAKGVVALRDPFGGKRVFQKVGGTSEISPCRLADEESLAPVAIFIGVGAPMMTIRARLDRLFAS